MPAFSTRNSTEPPLEARTAPVTSMVTVPTLGLGIMPRGPKTLPSRPTSGIRSGVAMQRSKLMLPPVTCSTEILGSDHVSAGGARLVRLGAARKYRDPHGAAGAVRQRHNAAHHLIGMARIDPEIHCDLDGFVELRLGAFLHQLDGLVERIELFAVDALAGLATVRLP